jgi:hypothetical protein
MGSKPTTPVFERAKIVHALDRAVSVVGNDKILPKLEQRRGIITITILNIIHLLVKQETSRDREYLFLLGPSEYIPPGKGDRIQSPKRRVF